MNKHIENLNLFSFADETYLIHDVGVHPTSILAITFTNKAAKEMKT